MPTSTARRNAIGNAGVLGGGTIGASWAALFAAHGLRVVVYDPNSEVVTTMRKTIAMAVQALSKIEPIPLHTELEEVQKRITFTTQLDRAVKEMDAIQENGPEILKLKLDLYATIDPLMRADTLFMSSTSGIPPSELQKGFPTNARNFVVGHPFNPPHLLPLVEVVGGPGTSKECIQRAMEFYSSLGKKPLHVRHEIPGHIANRLQSALFREIMYLLQHDLATVSELDTALEYGPGLRWGVMGASLLLHLGGGPEGARGYGDKYMPHLMSWYAPQNPVVNTELVDRWVKGTFEEAGSDSQDLARRRDQLLIVLINAKGNRKYGPAPAGPIMPKV